MNRTAVILGHMNGSVVKERAAKLISSFNDSSSASSVTMTPVAGSLPFPRSTPVFPESDDDIVIISALRTPICQAKIGGFKDTLPEDLLAAVFTAVIKDSGVDPRTIQDICVGNLAQPGAGIFSARAAQHLGGIPETTTLRCVNRFCGAGLQACADIAASIKAGFIDIGIAAGFECSTIINTRAVLPGMVINPRILQHKKAATAFLPLGISTDVRVQCLNISRKKQDRLAELSHIKAAKAQNDGLLDAEIVPVATKLKDSSGNETNVVISKDDCIRPQINMEELGKMKSISHRVVNSTEGNMYKPGDGAAAAILARRSYAKENNLPVLGVFRSYAVVGVRPEVIGMGPTSAINEALQRCGVSIGDIDIFEISETFAMQVVTCIEKLGIPLEKINPKGGSIALGFPNGSYNVGQVANLLHELKRRGNRALGIVAAALGPGMEVAAVFEYPGPQD